jgi:hypothetical protein
LTLVLDDVDCVVVELAVTSEAEEDDVEKDWVDVGAEVVVLEVWDSAELDVELLVDWTDAEDPTEVCELDAEDEEDDETVEVEEELLEALSTEEVVVVEDDGEEEVEDVVAPPVTEMPRADSTELSE